MTSRSFIPLLILAFFLCSAAGWAQKKQNLSPTVTCHLTDDGTLIVEGSGAIPGFKDRKKSILNSKVKKGAVRRIIIGEGITEIGNYAFASNSGTTFSSPIELVLPSTLTKIGERAFSLTKVTTSFPGKIDVGENAFSSAISQPTLEIPAGSTLGFCAFEYCHIDSLIINSPCYIGGRAFSSHGYTNSTDYIKSIVFRGDQPVHLGVSCFDCQDKIRSVYISSDRCVSLNDLKRTLPSGSDISYSTPESRAKEIRQTQLASIREQGVSAYVNYSLSPWDKFLASRLSDLEASTPEEAKTIIEKKISDWQVKGEFESTAQWQKRVNEKTRSQMAKKLADDYNATLNRTVDKAKEDYARLRSELIDSYFAPKIEERKELYKNARMTLRPYDADNQTFLISSPLFGDILLHVPLADAAAFKNDWKYISGSAEFEFAPVSETEVGLSKVTFFGNYPKKYVYDGKTDAKYAMTDVNYNFTPLRLTDSDLALVSVAETAAPTSATTVTTADVIKRQTATPERHTVNAGNATSATTPPTQSADAPKKSSVIDTDIPAGSASRPNTFALIIANENYSRTSPVPYAVSDGEVLRRYFNKTLGIPDKNILFATNATLNDIRYNLKRLSDVCHAFAGDADIIVYYAGHGVPDESSRDAYLLPVDGYPDDAASGMSLNELTNTLASLPSRHATLLLDACFSGAGREGDMLAQARGVAIKARPADGKRRLVVFSASQGTETAHPYHDEGHGLFTFYLLKKLNESKGDVTLGELADYISTNVRRTSAVEGKVQTPTVSASAENSDWKSTRL
ncbi:MAG: caspase family protein [Muribaculaceae bacterium]|nr:caspase family protein [Muribaculaceae bacterium]